MDSDSDDSIEFGMTDSALSESIQVDEYGSLDQ